MEPRDADWLGHLFTAHSRVVRAYAWRRVHPDDVDDIVADVFGTAWRERARVPTERALPWLYRTAAHVISHHHRAAARRTLREQRTASFPDTPDDTDAVADGLLVSTALDQLADADAEILRLAYWEDLAPSDIALVLGISPGSARRQLIFDTARGEFIGERLVWSTPDAVLEDSITRELVDEVDPEVVRDAVREECTSSFGGGVLCRRP